MALGEFLDRLGPTLASGIILALLAGSAATALAWRDHVSASAVRLGRIESDLAGLRVDLDGFRAPGGRFTKHDGERHQAQLDDHEKRLREQETRPPRLSPQAEALREEVHEMGEKLTIAGETLKHIIQQQQELCARMQACGWRPAR